MSCACELRVVCTPCVCCLIGRLRAGAFLGEAGRAAMEGECLVRELEAGGVGKGQNTGRGGRGARCRRRIKVRLVCLACVFVVRVMGVVCRILSNAMA